MFSLTWVSLLHNVEDFIFFRWHFECVAQISIQSLSWGLAATNRIVCLTSIGKWILKVSLDRSFRRRRYLALDFEENAPSRCMNILKSISHTKTWKTLFISLRKHWVLFIVWRCRPIVVDENQTLLMRNFRVKDCILIIIYSILPILWS